MKNNRPDDEVVTEKQVSAFCVCIFVQKNSGHLGYNFRFVEPNSLNGIDSEQVNEILNGLDIKDVLYNMREALG